MPRMRALVAIAVVCCAARAHEWPFGGNRDLYNLGLLGGKASDAAAPPPATEAPTGGRRSFSIDRPANDDGPERLRVELLFPEGPLERAGVVPGDEIVGVAGAGFAKGSLAALAKALGNGKVTLLVRPAAGGATRKVKVQVPGAGATHREIATAALDWLAGRQQEDGGFAEALSGKNGAVVATSIAGLAWLGSGAHGDNVRKAADFVIAAVKDLDAEAAMGPSGGANWSQVNWGLAHAAIFLGELHARTPERGVAAALHGIASALVRNQEKSGGWAHGPGGPNALGYVELNIVTGLSLMGLGLAQQSGYEIPADTLARAEAYLQESGGGDGGVGYSTNAGQKGQGNIGRTAASWLGYLALGKKRDPWCAKMGNYVRRNADKVLDGHASLMQHILLAGVAAEAQGGDARKTYWATMERDLVLARAPDGSLQPRPWAESLSMGSNSDVGFGQVWTTAAWAMVLVSERGKTGFPGFPALTGG